MQDLTKLSLTELTAIYNAAADKPIKKFSCSKEEAIKRVKAVMPKAATTPRKKEPKPGVGAHIVTMLQAGKADASIVLSVVATFPNTAAGSSETSARKHVAWYKSALKTGRM